MPAYKEAVCENCGKKFVGQAQNALRFCSHECADTFRRTLKPKLCKLCGEEFMPNWSGTIFCSNSCKSKYKWTLPELRKRMSHENPVGTSWYRKESVIRGNKIIKIFRHKLTGRFIMWPFK